MNSKQPIKTVTFISLRTAPSFRFSKGGVLGLLAKVYATWAGYPLYAEGKWELAVDAAELTAVYLRKPQAEREREEAFRFTNLAPEQN